MAGNRPGGEPTEAPTPKRLREARNRGQVARSAELTAAFGFTAGAATLLWFGGALFAQLLAVVGAGLRAAVGSADPVAIAPIAMRAGIDTVMRVSLPVAGAAAAMAAVAGFVQNPGLLTLAPLKPDLKKINPLEGFRRMFSSKTLVELGKSIGKLAVVGYLVYGALADNAPFVGRLAGQPLGRSFLWTASVAGAVVFRVILFYLFLGVVDYLWQRHSFAKEMRMTKEEVKKEYKESEGDPQHKAERRRVHQEVLRHQMVEEVKNADAVIINPTHIAVAIRYDQDTMDAPTVVASGRNLIARQIKEVARKHGVPVYRDVALARSLAELELGEQIPEPLFEAVAAVLRFVYEQGNGAKGAGEERGHESGSRGQK